VLLVIAVVLSVFKPQGVTRYGWRRQSELRRGKRAQRTAPTA